MTEQENATDPDEKPGKPMVEEPTKPALNPDEDSFDESQDESDS